MSIAAGLAEAIAASDESGVNGILNTIKDACVLNECVAEYGLAKVPPLSLACDLNKLTIVQALLEKGADVNQGSENLSQCPLHVVTGNADGKVSFVEILLKYGADINALDAFNRSPLHYACENNLTDIVDFLLTRGAELNIEDIDGETALLWSIQTRNKSLINRLVEAGCDVNCSDGKAIVDLIEAGPEFTDCINLMLKFGADIDTYKQIYFEAACTEGNIELMKLLKDYGVELNKANEFDWPILPILHTACEIHAGATDEVVKLLLEWGADVNGNGYGVTPLHLASTDLNKVLALLDYNANVNIKSYSRRTVLGTLIRPPLRDDEIKIVKLLLTLGAHVTKKDKEILDSCDSHIRDLVMTHVSYPMKLRDLCRQKVRLYLRFKVSEKVKLLQLPPCLKEFLLFSDII